MATVNSHSSIKRFLDASEELCEDLQVIGGYKFLSMPTLEEAIEPIVQFCPDIRRQASIAKEYVKDRVDDLTEDESASIYLYTNEWSPREECLYYVLNSALRSRNQQTSIHPWLLFIKILLTTLFKLPSYCMRVWRSAPLDLRKKYPVGETYTWRGFSSCLQFMSMSESEIFIGQKGERTIFSIECFNGKDIRDYSSLESEDEILLLPGTQFIVTHHNQPSKTDPNLIIIRLQQVEPPQPLLEEPVPGFTPSKFTTPTTERPSKHRSSLKKPVVSIGTIGHVHHGKTTLTAAITTVLAERNNGIAYTVEKIENATTIRRHDLRIRASYMEYNTPSRIYDHVDCSEHMDYVKGMISDEFQLDGVILVVDVKEGLMEQTREQIRLCQATGILGMTVFLNKCDLIDDEVALNLVEREVREILSTYGYPSDDIPFIRGSALRALEHDIVWVNKITDLIEAMDTYTCEPERTVDKRFLMPVEDVFTITGRGTVATGRIERGIIKVSDPVEIVGIRDTRTSICTGVEMFRKLLDQAVAGDNVGILLRGIERNDVQRGQVLVAPSSVMPYTRFEAEIYVLSKKEDRRRTPLLTNYRPNFRFRDTDVSGTIQLPDGLQMVNPGGYAQITVELIYPIALETTMRCIIREAGRTIGFGVVTKLIG